MSTPSAETTPTAHEPQEDNDEHQPTTITIEIDPARLGSVSDSTLATYWRLAQANPADGFQTKQPGELAERIGWEIIRRWLACVLGARPGRRSAIFVRQFSRLTMRGH